MKIKSISLLTLLIIPSLASAGAACPNHEAEFDRLESWVKGLRTGVQFAGCPDTISQNLAEAKSEYRLNFPQSKPQLKAEIEGLEVEGTEDELEFTKNILKGNALGLHDKAAHCKSAECLLTVGFGNEESALRALNIACRHGYTVSLSKQTSIILRRQTLPWTAEDIRNIDEVTRQFPKPYDRISTLKYFYKVTNLVKGAEGMAVPWYFGGEIRLIPAGIKKRDIRHEIAHHMDFTGSVRSSGDYLHDSSGFATGKWKQGWRFWRGQQPTHELNTVWDYGKTNAWEDFAVGVEAYMTPSEALGTEKVSSKALKEIDPKRYEILKKLFGGKEFQNDPTPSSLIQKIQDMAISRLADGCLRDLKILDDKQTLKVLAPDLITDWYQLDGREIHVNKDMNLFYCNAQSRSSFFEFASDPYFCSRQVDEPFDVVPRMTEHYVDSAAKIYSQPPPKEVQKCWDTNDFTMACPIRAALKISGLEAPSPESDAKLILALSKVMTPPNQMTEELFRKVPLLDLVTTCLPDKINHNEESCTGHMESLLKSKSVRFDDHTLPASLFTGMRQKYAWWKSNVALDEAIDFLQSETEYCHDSACKEASIQQELDNWTQLTGLKAPAEWKAKLLQLLK